MRRERMGLMAAALVLLAVGPSPAWADPPKRVLVLNSYHQGYEWTDDQTRGALAALGAPTKEIEIHLEYMGTKWVSDPRYFEQLRQSYRYKFAKLRFDAIIATDNDAFNFLRDHRDEVFGKVPTVFSGVNDLQPEELAGHDLFTGVNEVADFRSGLDLALRLHPGTRRIAVITDTSISGRKIKAQFMEATPAYRDRVEFEYLGDIEMGKLLERVASLPPDALVFHLLYFNDGTGKAFTNRESAALVSGAARVPVHGSWDFNLGWGIIGGKLLYGYGMGAVAGEMTLRVLHGQRIQDIPVVMTSPTLFMFDHRQLERFGIPRSALPAGSVIINEPPSFYAINKRLLWGGSLVMASLAAVVALLLRIIAQRRRAEEALREGEEKYRTLVDNVNVGIFRATAEHPGHFLQVNPAMARMFGRGPSDLLAARVADLFQDPNERTRLFEELSACGGVRDRECAMKKADGTVLSVSVTATVQRDEQGRSRWADGVLEDITERKRMEAEILRTQKLESVGLLAGGIAHDFNNLLTAILGNIALAKELASPGTEIVGSLADAEAASLRARDLTRRLLTFAKGGAPVKRPVSVAELVASSAQLALSGAKASCQLDIPGDVWCIDADEVQMGQVLTNLILNAEQAMPGGGTITIGCRNVAEAAQVPPAANVRMVELSVRDQGIGVRPENLGRIFDPFFTTKEKGRGLGLSTAYSILKQHGGSISVDSSPGAGSTFTLRVPASRSPATSPSPEAPRPAEGRGVASGKGKVLVMDDEAAVRGALGRMLAHLGYEVKCAADGAEAVELYSQAMGAGSRFDAVIMDLTIPGGMGGREAVRKLIEIDPRARAVVSSGYSNDPIMSDFGSFGFAGVIGKPYRLKELGDTLHEIIEKGEVT